MNTNFQPLIVGKGMAGLSIAKAISTIGIQTSNFSFQKPLFLGRGSNIRTAIQQAENPLVFIANPHALHLALLEELDALDLPIIFCEKPILTHKNELARAEVLKSKIVVFHGYRMQWGPQTIYKYLRENKLGKLIGIECTYWQASAAERILKLDSKPRSSWKNDPTLSGNSDTLIDLGPHWMDLILFLASEDPLKVQGQRSFIGSESAHRDTHLRLTLDFPSGAYAHGSVSKIVHGSGNDLNIYVFGERGSLSWSFEDPDILKVGEGRDSRMIRRDHHYQASGLPVSHGLGWLDGYCETILHGLRSINNENHRPFADLSTSIRCMKALLQIS